MLVTRPILWSISACHTQECLLWNFTRNPILFLLFLWVNSKALSTKNHRDVVCVCVNLPIILFSSQNLLRLTQIIRIDQAIVVLKWQWFEEKVSNDFSIPTTNQYIVRIGLLLHKLRRLQSDQREQMTSKRNLLNISCHLFDDSFMLEHSINSRWFRLKRHTYLIQSGSSSRQNSRALPVASAAVVLVLDFLIFSVCRSIDCRTSVPFKSRYYAWWIV